MSKKESIEDREDRERAEKDIATALREIKGVKLMLDTNVLITACTGSSFQKKAIADIATQNETHICDTIFWEFLRNCSLEKFRERYEFLSNKKLLNVEHEDENVQRTYLVIWAMYLCCYKDDPKRMASIVIPDLWIIATTAQRGIENILTSDESDFPDRLFHKKKYYVGKGRTIVLTTLNRDAAKKYLKEALDKGLLVSFGSFRNE